MEHETCPNCDRKIKGGLLGNHINTQYTDQINRALGTNIEVHCDRCSYEAFEAVTPILAERAKARNEHIAQNVELLTKGLEQVPVVSISAPPGWTFQSLSLVTAQSVGGTGVVSELEGGISDFLGTQSHAFVRKLQMGEAICLRQLRLKAVALGAHAIVGADVDYASVGTMKGMLMVCMSGTAVALQTLESLSDAARLALQQVDDARTELARYGLTGEKLIAKLSPT